MISIITISVLLVTTVKGTNILCVPTHVPSHLMEVAMLVSELPSRNHTVYMVLPEGSSSRKRVENLGIKVLEYHASKQDQINTAASAETNRLLINIGLHQRFSDMKNLATRFKEVLPRDCENMMNDKKLIDKLKAIKFDVAIVSTFMISNCNILLPYYLGIPVIETFANLGAHVTGLPDLPSVFPHLMTGHTDRMSFHQRLINTFATVLEPCIGYFGDLFSYKEHAMMREFAGGKSYADIRADTLMYLIPKDHILEYPSASMPHVKHIGGITIPKQIPPVPPQFQTIVDSVDDNGLIIVSFGSLASEFPVEVTQKFIAAFRTLPQTIIWRHTGDEKDLPANIHISKWLPQIELLAQTKTRLFITHGGNNGQYEAVFCGVPMLVMAIFGDQHHNAERVVHKGLGLKLSLSEFTAEELVQSVNTILNDPSYQERSNLYSKIAKDTPMTAQETSAFWIEHVIKFGGKHLDSPIRSMPLYQYFLIDVFVVIFIVIIVSCLVCVRCGRICKQCCRKPKKAKQQ